MNVHKGVFKKIIEHAVKHSEIDECPVVMQTDGHTHLWVYSKSNRGHAFFRIPFHNETPASVRVDGRDIKKALEVKGQNVTLEFQKGKLVVSGEKSVATTPFGPAILPPFTSFLVLEEDEAMVSFMKLAKDSLRKAVDTSHEITEYVKFTTEGAWMMDPVIVTFMPLPQQASLPDRFMHVTQLKWLLDGVDFPGKKDKVTWTHTSHKEFWVLKQTVESADVSSSYEALYMMEQEKTLSFPDVQVEWFDSADEIRSFTFDPREWDLRLSGYTTKCDDVYVYEQDGMMVFDPYGIKKGEGFQEGETAFPIVWAPLLKASGDSSRRKFAVHALKTLVREESEVIEISEALYQGHIVWRAKTPNRLISLLAKSEPNYEAIDKRLLQDDHKEETT